MCNITRSQCGYRGYLISSSLRVASSSPCSCTSSCVSSLGRRGRRGGSRCWAAAAGAPRCRWFGGGENGRGGGRARAVSLRVSRVSNSASESPPPTLPPSCSSTSANSADTGTIETDMPLNFSNYRYQIITLVSIFY